MATNQTALEKSLPVMAKNISVIKFGIMKLVSIQAGSPKTRADKFFADQANKEATYESKYNKTKPTQSKSSGGFAKTVGLGPGTSVIDFIKNIANMLIKGALIGAGTFGLAKLLENEDVRSTIKSFIKNLFTSIMSVIQKGSQMLTDVIKENWPEIKETIINTFIAIKNLLVTAIEKTGDILSDKRIWEGLWEIIQTIFSSIKKVLSTKVNIGDEEVSLGTIVGLVVIAFGALKGAVWLLKAAADSAAKSLFSVGQGKGVPGPTGNAPGAPGGQTGGNKPTTPAERAKAGKDALDKITQQRIAEEAAAAGRAALTAAGVVTGVAVGGTLLSIGAANTLKNLSKDELDVLAQSGGGDDTAFTAAILAESKKPTPAAKTPAPSTSPSQVSFGQTSPLTAEQASAAVSETKKFLGKNTVDFITAKEGFAAKAYLDPPGNNKNQYSIGHGHLIQPHEVKQGYILLGDGKKIAVKGPGGKDTTITKEEAKLLLNSDLPKYEKAAADPLGPEAWSKLNEDQRTALISYAYNAGSTAGLVKAGLKDAILKGDMERASEIIYQKGVKTSGGKYFTALEKRRLSESTLFAGAQFPNPYGKPPSEELMVSSQEKLAKNETKGEQEEINPLAKMLLDFDKLTGGKLGFDSKELNAAMNLIGKEIMSGPTFVDNSTNVSKAGGDVVTAQGSPAVRDENILNKIMAMRVA